MSRFITHLFETDEYLQEIESYDVCKWRINDVCCNDSCEELGDYPYPREMCNKESPEYMKCEHYEAEDGIIENEKEVKE